uniref:Defensin n=1 Tax=Clitoria ternatea TaxID=43366 RepID=H9CHQ4_CLITE|nr:defensin [Clitoria ternatea]
MDKKSLAGLCFLFLVLFVAQEVVVQTEAKTCENLADAFRGLCIATGNCDDHCKNKEHLVSGRCRDDLRCWCTKNC